MYQMSLLDVETGDTFDLVLGIFNEGVIVTQGYVPPTPQVNAQTLQPHSPTAMPGRHEATRSYLTEEIPLVIRGMDIAKVQELARDLEWFCERANSGYEVYLQRQDVITTTTTLRSRILVGELSLGTDSEFQLKSGHPHVQFFLKLTRDAWWEGARTRLQLSTTNSGNGSNTVRLSSRESAFIRTTVPGVLSTPLELRWQRVSTTVNLPAMTFAMLINPPATAVTHSVTITSSTVSVSNSITDIAKTTNHIFTPGSPGWYRVIAAPVSSTNLPADDTLHDALMLRAVGGFLAAGDEDWIGEWNTLGKQFGQSQRYTDLGTLYIQRTMYFFLQAVANSATVTMPAIDLIFIPTNSFRAWSACLISAGQAMIDLPEAYIDAGSDVVLPLETLDGAPLLVNPGEGHQILTIFQDRDTGGEGGQYQLSAFCRPRYLTI